MASIRFTPAQRALMSQALMRDDWTTARTFGNHGTYEATWDAPAGLEDHFERRKHKTIDTTVSKARRWLKR